MNELHIHFLSTISDAKLAQQIAELRAEHCRLTTLTELDHAMLGATGPSDRPMGKLRLRISRTKPKLRRCWSMLKAAETELIRRRALARRRKGDWCEQTDTDQDSIKAKLRAG